MAKSFATANLTVFFFFFFVFCFFFYFLFHYYYYYFFFFFFFFFFLFIYFFAAAANERPNCAVAHLSHLLISVSFKIDDATLEPCLYEPYSIGGKKFRYS